MPAADYYDRQARTLTLLAQATRDPETSAALLRLAAEHTALASAATNAQQQQQQRPPTAVNMRAPGSFQERNASAPNIPAPICGACGNEMRLVSAIPHSKYVNVDECNYRCDCGETSSNFFLRKQTK